MSTMLKDNVVANQSALEICFNVSIFGSGRVHRHISSKRFQKLRKSRYRRVV